MREASRTTFVTQIILNILNELSASRILNICEDGMKRKNMGSTAVKWNPLRKYENEV